MNPRHCNGVIARLQPKSSARSPWRCCSAHSPPISAWQRRRLYLRAAGLRGGDPKALAQAVVADSSPQPGSTIGRCSAISNTLDLSRYRGIRPNSGCPTSTLVPSAAGFAGWIFRHNMNLFGRVWQVQVQARPLTGKSDDIYRINVRNVEGKMIPLAVWWSASRRGDTAVIRYKTASRYCSGWPAPGVSSGQALQTMEEIAARTLPQGYAGEWTDTAFQEKRAEGKTPIILGLPCCLPICFSSHSMRAGLSPFRCCCRGDRHSRSFAAMALANDARSLRPDRHGRPYRTCSQEWHSDR